jgi:carbon storage regulator
MLVLSRRIGEEIVIADDIRVMVVALNRQSVRLGITAAPSITVDREEVHARRRELSAPRNSLPSEDVSPGDDANGT